MAVLAATAAHLAPDSVGLRRALRAGCHDRFRDIPVDWYDCVAATWRPTAVAAGTRPAGAGDQVDVFVPLDDGVAVAPAPADSLRLARGHSDAVTRFWTIRYRLRLAAMLATRLGEPSAAATAPAVEELSRAEAEMRDVWLVAFANGMPPRPVRSLFRPSRVRLVPGREDGVGTRRQASQDGALAAALGIFADELRRIQFALVSAGTGPTELSRHPLCVALSALCGAAAAELHRSHGPPGGVVLDPAVWGP